jgi:5S rRNA maturation endonuclease (ribonuclease M5)
MVSSEDSAVIESLSSFVKNLNDEEGALVIVEGVRDARALRNCGYSGELFMLCHNSNFAKLVSKATEYKKTILLLDNDSEGKNLSKRVQKTLSGRVRTDLFYQRKLLPASKGRIRHVEELSTYADRVARAV